MPVVGVRVGVPVGVRVAVGVIVAVCVRVPVCVTVPVAVAVGVSVAVGVAPLQTPSCVPPVPSPHVEFWIMSGLLLSGQIKPHSPPLGCAQIDG
jgi:hypothetical protein